MTCSGATLGTHVFNNAFSLKRCNCELAPVPLKQKPAERLCHLELSLWVSNGGGKAIIKTSLLAALCSWLCELPTKHPLSLYISC